MPALRPHAASAASQHALRLANRALLCPCAPAHSLQRLGAEALARLEQQLVSAGKSNVLELVQAVESWEARVVAAGASGLGALSGLEERLARIGRENLQVWRRAELSSCGRAVGAAACVEARH